MFPVESGIASRPEPSIYASDPGRARRTLLFYAVLGFCALIAGTIFLAVQHPEAALALYSGGGLGTLFFLVTMAISLSRAGRPLAIEIGERDFVIRREVAKTFEWSAIEAAWLEDTAGILRFRVLPSKKRDEFSLRGYEKAVQKQILGAFRVRLGKRFVNRLQQPIG